MLFADFCQGRRRRLGATIKNESFYESALTVFQKYFLPSNNYALGRCDMFDNNTTDSEFCLSFLAFVECPALLSMFSVYCVNCSETH